MLCLLNYGRLLVLVGEFIAMIVLSDKVGAFFDCILVCLRLFNWTSPIFLACLDKAAHVSIISKNS